MHLWTRLDTPFFCRYVGSVIPWHNRLRTRLGRMDFELARLGLGTASMAGVNMVGAPLYSRPGDETVDRILDASQELVGEAGGGCVMLDTSTQYGESEARLGAYFARRPAARERLLIATKWGLRFDPNDFSVKDYSLANLRESTARSARQLGRIDLLYLHTNPGVATDEVAALLAGRDGLVDRMREMRVRRIHGIRALGLSASTVEVVERLIGEPELLDPIDVIQLNANILLARPDLARALRHFGLGIVLNSPFRKADPVRRASATGRRAIFHALLDTADDALVLTGTIDPAHLGETVDHFQSWDMCRPLTVRYGGDAPCGDAADIEAAVPELLRSSLAVVDQTAANTAPTEQDPTVENIVDILIGSRKSRLGPAPSAEQREILCRRVERYVQARRPVAAILTWGPRKFRAPPAENLIDLSELAAIERLACLHAAVREIYPPGMRFSIFLEDFEGCYIEGEQPQAFAPYLEGLDRLVAVLGLGTVIRTVHTLDLFPDAAARQRAFSRLDENYRALKTYWHESEHIGIDASERCASYASLNRLGFHGVIGGETRRFYLKRLDRLLGSTRSPETKIEMTVRLLACVLLHRQIGMFDLHDGAEPVKLSFLQIAGGPAFLTDGRIDIRTLSTDVTKRALTPWSSKGYLRIRDGRILPALKTWAQAVEPGSRLLPGRLQLARGALAVDLGADFLQPQRCSIDAHAESEAHA